jgi:drug/metabolite transporter (DMT)-like permease
VSHDDRRLLANSVEGTSRGDFRTTDWAQLGLTAAIFGSAFLWISLALESIEPGLLSFGRVALGAATLALIPAARCRIRRVDWYRLVLASIASLSAPALLMALAVQRIPSAVAGMLVSSIPLFTAVIAAIETRTWPKRRRLTGLAIGTIGIVLLTVPNIGGAGPEAIGVLMVLLATLSYSVATTVIAPLQQTYGSLRVTLWILVVSSVLLLPLGVLGVPGSTFEAKSTVALVILGVVGTGVVWALFVGLVGRVGAVRSSIVGYLIPIVALVLGVAVLNENVAAIQIAGVLIALVGGYIISRVDRTAKQEIPAEMPSGEVPTGDLAEVPPAAFHMCR